MTDMSKHARRSQVTPVAWAVLVSMGATSVTYNVYHAVQGHHLSIGLALPYGIAPVFAALCLSHLVAVYKGGTAMRIAAFVVMLGAMGLSAGAIAAVVAPASPDHLQWVFGVLLDAAALITLRIILSEREKLSADVTAREQAEALAAEATGKAAVLEGELTALREELTQVTTALEAERQRRVPPRKPRRTSARKRTGTSAPEPGKLPPGTSGDGDTPDIDTEARILSLIASGMSPSKAGLAAGKSDSYGRQVARLARAAQMEPAGDSRSAGDMS